MFNDTHGLTLAVLNGRKTMTRRKFTLTLDKDVEGELIRVYPSNVYFDNEKWLFDFEGRTYFLPRENYPRYKVGEVVAIAQSYKELYPNADFEIVGDGFMTESAGWSNKMFVRTDLMHHHIKITDVKIERLQDISDKDCLHEGIIRMFNPYGYVYKFRTDGVVFNSPREAFVSLIDKVSGKGTWENNPWVIVYSFERVD